MPAGTTATTRKKSRSRKTITVKKAEEEKQAAIDAALEAAQQEWEEQERIRQSNNDFGHEGEPEFEDEDTDLSAESGYFGEPASDVQHDLNDVFIYTAKYCEEHNIVPIYYIKKDGNILPSITGQCSWDILIKRHGGGAYKIEARNSDTKKYIKGQSANVADVPRDEIHREEPVVINNPPPQNPADLNKMFEGLSNVFMQMQDMVQKKEAREDRDEKRSSDSHNTLMMQMMTEQSKIASENAKSQSEMLLKIAEMQNKQSETQSKAIADVLKQMDDKFARTIEAMLKKEPDNKDALSTKDLIELIGNSRSEGMETMQTLVELAETFSANQAPSDSKESMLGSLVKGMLPILTKANQSLDAASRGSLPQGQIPHPATHQPSSIPLAQPQRPGGPVQAQPSQQAPRRTHRPVNAPSPTIFSPQALGLPTFTDNVSSSGSTGPKNQPVTPGHSAPAAGHIPMSINPGGPGADVRKQSANTISVPQGDLAPRTSDAVIVDSEIKGTKFDRKQSDLYKGASVTQQTIAELAGPTIAMHLFDDKITPNDTAKIVLGELFGQGYNAQLVCEHFNVDLMMQSAAEFGVGEEKRGWFKEFYDTIQNEARVSDSGAQQPTLS